jgi:hypothetical protein
MHRLGHVPFGQRNLTYHSPPYAGVAQLVEQRICNPQVVGSSPASGSERRYARVRRSAAAGSSTTKVEPSPNLDSTQILPSMRRTSSRQM